MSTFTPNLVRSGSESDPSVVKGDDKLSLVQLHVDLPTSEQHQRVDGHHAAVPDEDAACFHLLMVNKVGAGVVAGLWHKGKVRQCLSEHWLQGGISSSASHHVIDGRGVHKDTAVVLCHESELVGFGLHLHGSFAGHLVISLRSSDLKEPTNQSREHMCEQVLYFLLASCFSFFSK